MAATVPVSVDPNHFARVVCSALEPVACVAWNKSRQYLYELGGVTADDAEVLQLLLGERHRLFAGVGGNNLVGHAFHLDLRRSGSDRQLNGETQACRAGHRDSFRDGLLKAGCFHC